MPDAYAEVVGLEAAEGHVDAWRELSARALEANVFAEPAFVLNALTHFAKSDRLRLLMIWEDASRGRLIGAVVLEFSAFSPGLAMAQVWQSNQAGLAALLLDRQLSAQALLGLMDWLARERPNLVGLLVPTLDSSGLTMRMVDALGLQRGAPVRRFGQRSRAILGEARLAGGFQAGLPGKRLKEWRRQMRRLKERGDVAFRVAGDGAAIEQFLALEATGWKGAQRTALSANADLAAFTRSMLAALAREARLSIHFLELDGEALATGIVLRSGDRAFYWKTAYAEAYAEFSPGLQLTLELSRAQQNDPSIAMTDSCAIENHPMIDRLWTSRLSLVDCILPSRPGGGRRVGLWLARESALRRLKEAAKRLINPLRGRKRS
jgi:CelD/BcsL family acetyltransferase involved in cellulose biosynthesis